MPVSIQSCECCPVVVDWYLMLCHTQCIRSPAWSIQWPGTVSKVCLCPLPTSSEPPRGYGSEPPCIGSLAHWYAWVPPEPEELRWLLHRQKSVTNLDCRWSLNPRSWCSKIYDFTFVGCKLETIPCCPFLYCIYKERPRKQIARSPTYSVLKMSLAIREGSSLIFSPKHVTARTPPIGAPSWVEFAREYTAYSDPDSAVLEIFRYKNRQSASDANLMKVSSDAIYYLCQYGPNDAQTFCYKINWNTKSLIIMTIVHVKKTHMQ